MDNSRFKILSVCQANNSAYGPQQRLLSVPGSSRMSRLMTLILYINVLHRLIKWFTGRSAIPVHFSNVGSNFHRVKLVTYGGLIDSRLAPDVKVEGVHQSQ